MLGYLARAGHPDTFGRTLNCKSEFRDLGLWMWRIIIRLQTLGPLGLDRGTKHPLHTLCGIISGPETLNPKP